PLKLGQGDATQCSVPITRTLKIPGPSQPSYMIGLFRELDPFNFYAFIECFFEIHALVACLRCFSTVSFDVKSMVLKSFIRAVYRSMNATIVLTYTVQVDVSRSRGDPPNAPSCSAVLIRES